MAASLPALRFVVSATNQASGPLAKIRAQLGGLVAPANQANRQVSALSRGLSAMPLRSFGRQAADAAMALRDVSGPLGALTSAATLAGLARMTSQWGAFGSQLGISSQRIGTNAAALHSMQGAARLMGGTAEGMTQSLADFAETLTDAVGGRNKDARGYLALLKVEPIDKATGKLRDHNEILDESLDRIAKIGNPQLQARVLRGLGLGDAEFAALTKGAKAFREAQRQAAGYGAMSKEATDKARAFAAAQTRVGLALEGVRNSLVERFAPAATGFLDTISEAVKNNRELASSGVAVAALLGGPMAIAAGRLALSFVGIGGGLAALSRFRPPAWILPLLGAAAVTDVATRQRQARAEGRELSTGDAIRDMLQSWGVQFQDPAAGGAASGGEGDGVGWFRGLLMRNGWQFRGQSGPAMGAGVAQSFFTGQGWTKEQSAGIVANLQHESGLRAGAIGDNGRSFGLAQWNGPRLRALGQYIGRDPTTATTAEQLAFIQYELTHGEKAAGDALRRTQTAGEAGAVFSRLFERPREVDAEAVARAQTAESLSRLQGAGGGAPNGQVAVRVDITGAPPGTRANATASGAGVTVAPPRVERGLPAAVAP